MSTIAVLPRRTPTDWPVVDGKLESKSPARKMLPVRREEELFVAEKKFFCFCRNHHMILIARSNLPGGVRIFQPSGKDSEAIQTTSPFLFSFDTWYQQLRCPLRYSKMNMADRREPSGRFSRHCQCPPVCIDYWPSYSLWHAWQTWTSAPLSKVESSWTCLKNKVECQTGNLINLIILAI